MTDNDTRLSRRRMLQATGVALGAAVGVGQASAAAQCYDLPVRWKAHSYGGGLCPTGNQPDGPVLEPQRLYIYDTCMGGTWGNREFGYTLVPEGAIWIPLDALEPC